MKKISRDSAVDLMRERKEKKRKWDNAYKERNRDKINAQAREYGLKNREKKNEYNRLYRLNNKEKIAEIQRVYYIKNKEKRISRNRKWAKDNSERMKMFKKVYLSKRRALGYISIKIIQQVYEDNIKNYGTLTCYLCSKPIEFGRDSLEHKTPISRGGTNEYCNLRVAHSSCNSSKGKKTFEEWVKYETNRQG